MSEESPIFGETAPTASTPVQHDAAGHSAMAATATGMELADDLALQRQGAQAGLSSIDAEDVAKIVARAEAVAAQMMASGASDKEILQAIANLPGYNADVANTVNAKVEQQLAADKFNMMSSRNGDAAQDANIYTMTAAGGAASQDTSLVGGLLGAASGAGAAALPSLFTTPEQQRQQDDGRMAFTTASLTNLGQMSLPDVPDVRTAEQRRDIDILPRR